MTGHFAGLSLLRVYFPIVSLFRQRFTPVIFVILCLASLAGTTGMSADVTAGASPGLNASLVRLFGGFPAFTAQLELRMVDAKGVETLNAPMKFSLLDGKMRGDLDVTRLKAKDLPALASSAAASVGMDRVVTLVRPDRKETYLLYPKFKACVFAPIDETEIASLKKPAKVVRTPLAKETLDGHPCSKQKVVVTEPDGRHDTAIVWYATDLKNFPVQIETKDDTDTIIMRFRDVKIERPAAKDFDLPEGTQRYDDPSDLTKAVMKQYIGQALFK